MGEDLLFKAAMYRAQGKSLKEEQRKEVQLAARQAGYVYDEQKQDYTPSPENYQAQAMAAMAEQLKSLQSTMMNNETWNTLTSDVQAGNFDGMNALIQKPEYKKLFEPMGVTGVRQLSRDNASDMAMLKNNFAQLGYKGGDLDTLLTITQDEEQWKNFRTAFPVVIGPDGKSKITSLADVNMALGGARRTDATNTSKLLGDQYALGINALSGKLSSLVEAEKNKVVTAAETEQLKLEDMEAFLANNPDASLADYIQKSKYRDSYGANGGVKPSSLEKEAEYIKQQYGEEAAQEYIQRKIKGSDNTPAAIKTEAHKLQTTQAILDESGAKNIYDVDISKLTGENRLRFQKQAQEDAKNIKPDEYNALFTIQEASDKFRNDELATATGIADATLNQVFDRLGLDLPDKTLVQSANYNIVKNYLTKAMYGAQVTGNELGSMTNQIGTEFRSDKTVRLKLAETLDAIAAKFEGYKEIAPAFYAASLRDRISNLRASSQQLKGDKESASSNTKVIGGVEHTKQGNKWVPIKAETTQPKIVKTGDIVSGYKFLGGDPKDKNNWEKVK